MSVSRTEYKFHISPDQYRLWKEEIAERVDPDTAGNEGDYPIISQYYDTLYRDCYWEKQRSWKSRRKIRVRVYGSEEAEIPPAAFLEVKHKLDGLGVKRRLQMPLEKAQAFALGDNEVLREMRGGVRRSGRIVIDEVLGMVANGHQPSMQIRYDRNAFSTPDGTLRITFDNNLLCRTEFPKLIPDDPGFTKEIIPRGECVMEVKAIGPVPYWFRVRAGEMGLTRRSFSKYCTSLEKHDPVLRAQIGSPAAA